MSKTLYVEFKGHGFWAFDVVSGVFLKHLIDAAAPWTRGEDGAWLAPAIERWRINAVFPDCGLFLDEAWSPRQIQTVTEIAEAASDELSKRTEIPAHEIESSVMFGFERIFARGVPCVTTASLIRFGRAFVDLLNERLAKPPPGTEWFFGTEDAETTVHWVVDREDRAPSGGE
jgi:hypothetical protein